MGVRWRSIGASNAGVRWRGERLASLGESFGFDAATGEMGIAGGGMVVCLP